MSFYEDIVQGLNEAIEYKKGNVKLRTSDVTIAPLPEIKSEDVKNIVKYIHLFHGNISFLYFCHTKICKS